MKLARCLLFVLVISGAAGVARAQSLADYARQERERNKDVHSRVFTNADLGPNATEPKPAAEPANSGEKTGAKEPATAGNKPAGPSEPTDSKGRGEKYWRATFAQARADLARAEDKLKLLDLRLNELNSRLLTVTVYTDEVTIRAAIEDAQKEQIVARLAVEQDQQKLVELEDELRRSGGLPGWAR